MEVSTNITYAALLQLLPAYQERRDPAFLDMLPTFINLAENRIATDLKQQGFQSVVTGTLPLDGVLAKPSWWRETISMMYLTAAGEYKPIFLRSYQYCRNYWPNPALKAPPVYYADYNVKNFLIVPTPESALELELSYYARLEPLGPENQDNWLTLNAPQALFYASMLEASIWAKSGAETWSSLYEQAKSSLQGENTERLTDRATVMTRP